MSLYFVGWDVYFQGWGSIVADAPQTQGGAKRNKRDDDLIYRVLDKWDEIERAVAEKRAAKAAYEELTRPEVPEPIREEAARIVTPFAAHYVRRAIPEVREIDWSAVEQNAKQTQALVALWRELEAIHEDDEEVLSLELFG